MNLPLTSKQQKIYTYIRQYLLQYSEAPTLEQLREVCHVGSINTIVDHLKALEKKGYILRRKHAKRNIALRELANSSPWATVSIPVTASVGCDDLSVFANEQHDEFIEVDRNILKPNFNYVAVRAIGDSMSDANIHDGDYVLVQLTEDIESGDRVVVVVGDMVTVKRIEKREGVTILRPESNDPKYKPIILRGDFRISGKVVCTIPHQSMDMTEVIPIPGE